MIRELQELVLSYHQAQLDAWINGDRRLIPAFVDPTTLLRNSPMRHFAEMFVLRHFHQTKGWTGFSSYALGPELPGSQRRRAGRAKVEEIIPRPSLNRLRALRATAADRRFGGGTPDLFLYDHFGRYKFVEVKKGTDRMTPSQLRCLAQIVKALRCDVEVVHLRAAGQQYVPKTYLLDLCLCEGWQKSSNRSTSPHRKP